MTTKVITHRRDHSPKHRDGEQSKAVGIPTTQPEDTAKPLIFIRGEQYVLVRADDLESANQKQPLFSELPDILDKAGAASALDVSERYVQDLLNDGRLKGYREGNKWKIPRTSLLEYVNGKLVSSGGGA